VTCYWMGNTEAVAKEHYLTTTDADFERAAGGGKKAAHFQAQSGAVTSGKQQQAKPANPVFTALYGSVPNYTSEQVGPPGLEPGTKGLL
jgi:hypothetical protein